MYSHFRQGALRLIANLSTHRFDHLSAAKFLAVKLAVAPRNFNSIVQSQGQAGVREPPSDDGQILRYGEAEELIQRQSLVPGAGASSLPPYAFTSISEVAPTAPEAARQRGVPLYHRDSKFDKEPYWQKIGRWKDVPEEQFLSHRWNVSPPSSPLHLSTLTNFIRLPKTFKVPALCSNS